jgi:hypothetical protein
MKVVANLLMLFAFFSLSSCNDVDNEFIVADPADMVSSAEIMLCGERHDMTRSGSTLQAKMPISCEGSGRILVQLTDSEVISCPIGYVTPGADQRFEFVISAQQCR